MRERRGTISVFIPTSLYTAINTPSSQFMPWPPNDNDKDHETVFGSSNAIPPGNGIHAPVNTRLPLHIDTLSHFFLYISFTNDPVDKDVGGYRLMRLVRGQNIPVVVASTAPYKTRQELSRLVDGITFTSDVVTIDYKAYTHDAIFSFLVRYLVATGRLKHNAKCLPDECIYINV